MTDTLAHLVNQIAWVRAPVGAVVSLEVVNLLPTAVPKAAVEKRISCDNYTRDMVGMTGVTHKKYLSRLLVLQCQ